MEKPKFRTENHEIISIFLEINKTDKYFWPREIKIAKKLLEKYSIDFFRVCKKPLQENIKLPSLAWFLSENGKQFLSKEYFEFQKGKISLEEYKPEIFISETKIGEDIKVIRKPKTLKEFLQLYGKKSN